MSRRHYNLPPLATLSAFEAAARHLSFKNAAQELSVTPGAVSHQIKALEGALGALLFERKHRGVELTEQGQELYRALSTSFGEISRQIARIQNSKAPSVVTVGSTTAVAALWLSPVILRFWRDYPDININQITQDRPFETPRDFDFFIRYGRDWDSGLTHTEIYRDDLVPVATPEMAEALSGCTLSDLAQQRLIHLQAETRSWTSWSDWFVQLGFEGDLATGPQVTSYSVALQMAGNGAGVALGWKRLVRPLLKDGTLATITPHVLPAPNRFYLVGMADGDLPEPARTLKRYILEHATAQTV
ncbi:MAG: LysR substrate-binding domain-containing protein [Pseudomonadota bacterium]